MKEPVCYKIIKEYILIIAGSAITAIGVSMFLVPGHIAAGGVSGLGVLIEGITGIPVSISVLLINTALFMAGFKMMSMPALIKTAVATILLAIFIEVFSEVEFVKDDTLLGAVYGGFLVGCGTGIVVICGASTGGSDFAAILIKRCFSVMSVAKLILIIDFAIVLLSGVVFSDYNLLLYAILSLFVMVKTADFVIDGINFSKLVFIISESTDDISSYILNVLERGVTTLEARGGYSGSEKKVIMSVVSPNQFPALKKFVKRTDEKAFIILSDARSVFGEGFNIE